MFTQVLAYLIVLFSSYTTGVFTREEIELKPLAFLDGLDCAAHRATSQVGQLGEVRGPACLCSGKQIETGG